jgi:RNA polymerase-binding transcription factor DksA
MNQEDSREALQRQREELLERIDAIKRDYASGLDRDLEEQAIQLENAEVREALLKQAYEQLELIDRKLDRMS